MVDAFFAWNFGDPQSGYWSTTQKSKNSGTGFVTAHVFDTPGTYTVSLSVKDRSGNSGSAQRTIQVNPANSMLTTYCVSSTPVDFSGCPNANSQYHISSANFQNVVEGADANTRVLFRGNRNYTSGSMEIPERVVVGAFATSEGLPRLTLTSTGDWEGLTVRGWSKFSDFDVLSSTPGKNGIYLGYHSLVYRINARNLSRGVGYERAASYLGGPGAHEYLFVVDSQFSNILNSFALTDWDKFSYLGNAVGGTQIFFGLRVKGSGIHIAHNVFTEPAYISPANAMLRLYGNDLVVTDNVILNSPGGHGVESYLGPNQPPVYRMLAERNFFAGACHGALSSGLGADGIGDVLRNNIVVNTPDGIKSEGSNKVSIYNNTVHSTGANDSMGVEVNRPAVATRVFNNLLSFPNTARSLVRVCGGLQYQPSVSFDNNLYQAGPFNFGVEASGAGECEGLPSYNFGSWQSSPLLYDLNGLYTSPLLASSANSDVRLTVASPARAMGMPGMALDDFSGELRTSSQSPDIGALSYRAASSATTYNITGRILKNGQAMSGVVIYSPLLGTRTTDAQGNFAFNSVPSGTRYTLIPAVRHLVQGTTSVGHVFYPVVQGGLLNQNMFHQFDAYRGY